MAGATNPARHPDAGDPAQALDHHGPWHRGRSENGFQLELSIELPEPPVVIILVVWMERYRVLWAAYSTPM
jgi:hypothetical protein